MSIFRLHIMLPALAAVAASTMPGQQILSFTIPPASPGVPSTYVAYAWCVNASGYFVPYCDPGLGWGYYQYTGGHVHDDPTHISNSYSGYVTTSGTNTDSIGYQVTYHATRTGEEEYIEVCGTASCATTYAYISYPSFQQLYAGYNFILVGDKPWHPDNHWALQSTITSIVNTVQSYSENWYTYAGYQTIGVNDQALPYGGVFDICETSAAACTDGVLPWQPPHKSHDYGKASDFRANGAANSILPAAINSWLGTTGYCYINGLNNLMQVESVGTSNEHIHCDAN
jgi:hypothetical protein